jgi:Mg-chelatase subunit ChlD
VKKPEIPPAPAPAPKTVRVSTSAAPVDVSPPAAPERAVRALLDHDGQHRMVLIVRDGVAPAREPGSPPSGTPLKLFAQCYITGVHGQSQPEFLAVSEDGFVDLGWIPADACREWSTRLALGPTDVLNVYESEDAALQAALSNESTQAFARSIPSALDLQFPIAETKVVRADGRSIVLTKIHFLGRLDDVARAGGVAKPPAPRARPATDVTQSTEDTSRRLSKVDIVFVMDATASMQQYIDATKETVASLARTLAADRADVRFALIAFRDASRDSQWVTRNVVPLVSFEDFEKGLTTLKAEGGGDDDEAGFVGVEAALNFSWRADNLGQRIVLVVGQTPFHTAGPGNPSCLTPASLATVAEQRNVRIHALQVDCFQTDGAREQLTTQLRGLAAPTGGSVFRVKDAGALARVINESAAQASTTAHARVTVLEGHVRGDSLEKVARVEGMPIAQAQAAFEFLRESNCILSTSRNDATMAAASGWVITAVDDVPRTRTYVLSRRSELQRLGAELFDLASYAEADTIEAFRRVAAQPRKGDYFDSYPNQETLASFLRGHGVYLAETSILSRSLQQVRQMPERDRKALSERVMQHYLPKLLEVYASDIWTGPGETAFVPESIFP